MVNVVLAVKKCSKPGNCHDLHKAASYQACSDQPTVQVIVPFLSCPFYHGNCHPKIAEKSKRYQHIKQQAVQFDQLLSGRNRPAGSACHRIPLKCRPIWINNGASQHRFKKPQLVIGSAACIYLHRSLLRKKNPSDRRQGSFQKWDKIFLRNELVRKGREKDPFLFRVCPLFVRFRKLLVHLGKKSLPMWLRL